MARDKITIPLDHRVAPVRRGARGSISRLPSGSLRVRVYAGIHPVTGRQRNLSHTVPDGPTAFADAEAVSRRLVDQVRDCRYPRPEVTVTELLDRHVELVHATEATRRSYRHTVTKHLHPGSDTSSWLRSPPRSSTTCTARCVVAVTNAPTATAVRAVARSRMGIGAGRCDPPLSARSTI
jgi:hypothetical protein